MRIRKFCLPSSFEIVKGELPVFPPVRRRPKKLTILKTALIVSNLFSIPLEAIGGKSRVTEIKECRFIIMYLCYPYYSLAVIGASFNRDHTTVINAIRQTDAWKENDDRFFEKFESARLAVEAYERMQAEKVD